MTIDRFDYRSQHPHAPDGFAGYHRLYSCGTDVDRGAGPFRASVTACRFRQLLVFDRRLSGVSHTRSAVRVRRDGFDHITMQLLLSGTMVGGALGEQRSVQPGEIIVFDTTEPQRTVVDDARLIALSLPRHELERHLVLPRSLHGTILSPQAGGLLAEFIQSLVRLAPTLPAHATDYASTVVATLAASALRGEAGLEPKLREDHASRFRIERIERYMTDHLSDPGLDATRTAAALGLSRSTLDRSLTPAGGFGALLSRLRLDRMRAALRQPDRSITVGAIAHGLGFRSLSHCSRVFSSRFGLPPQRWREQYGARRMQAEGAPGTLEYLLQELR